MSAVNPIALEALRGKSLLIFDDGMRSKDGHWFEYNRAVTEIHHALGVKVTIVCHESFNAADELEAAGAEVLSLVRRSAWAGDGAGAAGFRHEMKAIKSLGSTFAQVVAPILRSRRFDCVFAPNARIHDVFAWSVLGVRGHRKQVGKLALLFRFALGRVVDNGPPRFARKLQTWRILLAGLRSVWRGKLRLLTDSSRLAAEYRAVAGVRLSVTPSPRTMHLPPPRKPQQEDVLFATLGAARIDKGVDIFQMAIRNLIDTGRDQGMRFRIQWNRDVPMADGAVYPRDPAVSASDRVEFIEQPLSSDAYRDQFDAIQCMVLPYRRLTYHSQISGVAVEAACAGIPMIYTDDSWLSDFAGEQGAGIGVADGNVAALAEAMLEIRANFERYQSTAREAAIVARRRNSEAAFVEKLWGIDAGGKAS